MSLGALHHSYHQNIPQGIILLFQGVAYGGKKTTGAREFQDFQASSLFSSPSLRIVCL